MTATRLAGKALGDFLKKITPVVGSAVEQAVLNKLVGTYSPQEVTKTGPAGYRYPAQEGDVLIKPTYATSPGIPEYGMYRENYTETVIPEAANTRIGKIVTKLGPENIAKVAGAAAPAAALGGIAAGVGLVSKISASPENVYAQSQYSLPVQRQGTPVAFANQQYVSGMSPMTNQTAADALLEQQKFQHQLRLIEARQAAQQGVGIGGRTSGGLDIMGLSQQVFAPVSY
jgi:hypothetical protein